VRKPKYIYDSVREDPSRELDYDEDGCTTPLSEDAQSNSENDPPRVSMKSSKKRPAVNKDMYA